ncbi:hypothetical protein T06_9933 [Trichinella sp. T6]|nr:hypothetical protein T06_9933 [Trichinella sp. T6]
MSRSLGRARSSSNRVISRAVDRRVSLRGRILSLASYLTFLPSSSFPRNIIVIKKPIRNTVFISNSEQGLSPIRHSKIPGTTTTHARSNQRISFDH